jgi:hypothetical protein
MLTTKKQQEIAHSNNKERKTILIVLVIVSLSIVAAGIASATRLAAGYGNAVDSYKQTICTGKAIEFAQKGIIRDIGGFNGAIYECTHMNYPHSIYGDVSSAAVVMHNKGV